MTRPAFLYEEPERFGESLTTARPWNTSALASARVMYRLRLTRSRLSKPKKLSAAALSVQLLKPLIKQMTLWPFRSC